MGGMLTSLADLGRYVGALLAAWPPRDGAETGPCAARRCARCSSCGGSAAASVVRDPAGALQLNAGGYGYGLGISQTCPFRHVVAHSGGLPGFGSQMRWLPEHGVGIIAFGNLTYTGWGGVATTRSRRWRRPAACSRAPSALAGADAARDAVSRLIVKWDDALADRVAAMNLYLDRSKDRRRAAIEALRAKVGACTPPDRASTRWRTRCAASG